MTRTIIIAIALSCPDCFADSVTASPPTNSSSGQTALNELRQAAYADWKEGKPAAAIACYREVLRVAESSHVAAEQFAQDLHSIGVLSSEEGHYAEAKRYLQRELDVLAGSSNQAAAGRAYLSLAGVLQLEGAFSAAETAYKSAIDVLGDGKANDAQIATALNRLGWLYTLWGRTEEAGQYLHRAWNLARNAIAPDDPLLIRFLDTQASFLTYLRKYSEAEKLWKRALAIGDKVYAGEESKYGEVFLHLGQLYAVLRDNQSAENMFQRVLAMHEQTTQSNASVRAVVIAELARIDTDRHKYGDAERLFSKSIQLLESERDKVPLSYSLVRSYFGDYYMDRSRWQDAETQYRSALTMRTAMLGENAADVAASMFSLSKALRKLHRKKEADQYLAQAVAIAASQKRPFYEKDTIDVRAFRQK